MPTPTYVPNLENEIKALSLNIEGLLKLLGGTKEERERFIETVTGLTSRAQYRLAADLVHAINAQLTSASAGLSEARAVAKESRMVVA